nr:immunoglobulin light chain junction region [Macaca mulatta]MOX43507.1 immunoglobulin light chain junction region [Macaca mulatta]MOX43857.1 immunoglobulin light chain junction region [Macaca mulatta]MOX44647.1 immunoglobulin light chain junction region [Macaca mulatta]MOX45472.1 immunoglobulin light chain junction region [Macaca mulatta]
HYYCLSYDNSLNVYIF